MPTVAAAPPGGEALDHVGGDVGRRGVDDLAEVAERQAPAELAGVVGVERAPAAVTALHALEPSAGPRSQRRVAAAGRVGVPHAASASATSAVSSVSG